MTHSFILHPDVFVTSLHCYLSYDLSHLIDDMLISLTIPDDLNIFLNSEAMFIEWVVLQELEEKDVLSHLLPIMTGHF